MIEILTGTPGAGKTSWVIERVMKEIAKGRKVFVDNIPDLILNVEKAGRIDQWELGTWLSIDTYDPLDVEDEDFDPDSCWKENGNGRKDKGALIIVDEAQRWFRPRGGRTVPNHVAALEVHRHQGLDFLFITQNLALLDTNLKMLCSKHTHIRLGSFGRKIYEWPEVANPNSKQQRDIAAKSSYKPNPAVFGLYKSASLHTKLKHKLPNAFYMIVLCLIGFSFLGYFIYQRVFAQLASDDVPVDVPAVASPSQSFLNNQPAVRGAPRSEAKDKRTMRSELRTAGDSFGFESDVVDKSLSAYVSGFASRKGGKTRYVIKLSDGRELDARDLRLNSLPDNLNIGTQVSLASLEPEQIPKAMGDYGGVAVRTDYQSFYTKMQHDWERLHPRKFFRGVWLAGAFRNYKGVAVGVVEAD